MLMSKTFCVFLFVFIVKLSGAIYNGKTVPKGLWPWKVALTYSSTHMFFPREYFCGGVIISQTFVITAAHCLHPKDHDKTKDSDIVLIFGAHELNVTREPGAISVPLLKSYIHEDWNPDSKRFDADIALLEIENPITFSNLIKPICLWTGDIGLDSFDENVGTVVGWGKTLHAEYSNVPLLMTVPIVDNEKCWLDHNDLLKLSSNRTFCGGPRDGITTPCNGDNGSGLYLENNRKHYLKGLVSAIWVRCDATTYTVYTDIFMFTDWIKLTAKIERTEPTHRSSSLSPWKVALVYSSNHRTHPSEYFCGGVIISQTFVITAAHCLHPKDHDRTNDTDIVLRFDADDLDVINEPRSISKPLKRSYIHDDWNSNSNIYDADIALLEIENPLTFSNFIKPINLWTGDNTLYETEGTVVGWGMNHLKNQSSNKPVQLIVPVVNNEKCWMDNRELFTISSNRTFCGGLRDGISTPCDGSSGSGLYVENQKKFYLKGLVSAIWNRCDATAYTVYTNVFMFTDWIKKTAEMEGTVPINSSRELWPWIVALFNRNPDGYFCGGVIISQTFVITAAHCLHPKQMDRTKDADIMLIFGAHELNVTGEPGAISVPLLKSYIHEDWNSASEKYDADIALLEIENPLKFSNLIKPICLWTGDIAVDSLNTNVGTVVGWGKTSNDEYSYVPLQMTVPIVDNEKCWLDHNDLLKLSSHRTFCGGSRYGISTLGRGSSGSGLYVENQKKYYLKGLVSAIWNSYDASVYTVYTNVFKFTAWIKKTAAMERTEPSSCFVSSMNEYNCKVSAHIKHETDVLSFSDSHMEGKTDNDVTFLNFENSTVDRIPSFKNFNKLTNLKMWNVKLKEITESSFTSCPNLISLGLRFNKLAKVPSGAFKDLKHLISLGVGWNPIVEIEQNAFQGLVSLQHLFMCATKLTVINEEVFHPLVGLKMLHLNHTLIETIHSNAFKSMIRLWYLNLEHGRLTSIDENVLKPLRSLQYLLLNNNLIKSIQKDAFKSLKKLKRLSLRENKLEMFSSSLFLSQGKLEQLSIKDNRIWIMEKGTLNNFKALTKFDARGNICVDKLYQNAIDFEAIETLCPNGWFDS